MVVQRAALSIMFVVVALALAVASWCEWYLRQKMLALPRRSRLPVEVVEGRQAPMLMAVMVALAAIPHLVRCSRPMAVDVAGMGQPHTLEEGVALVLPVRAAMVQITSPVLVVSQRTLTLARQIMSVGAAATAPLVTRLLVTPNGVVVQALVAMPHRVMAEAGEALSILRQVVALVLLSPPGTPEPNIQGVVVVPMGRMLSVVAALLEPLVAAQAPLARVGPPMLAMVVVEAGQVMMGREALVAPVVSLGLVEPVEVVEPTQVVWEALAGAAKSACGASNDN